MSTSRPPLPKGNLAAFKKPALLLASRLPKLPPRPKLAIPKPPSSSRPALGIPRPKTQLPFSLARAIAAKPRR